MESLLWIFGVGLLIFLIYGIIPTVLFRMQSIGLVKKGTLKNTLALTFDDGPNPHYTPQVLDILKQYRCQATFFVVAEKAAKHPELVKRMNDEGHAIGIHHYTHTNSWFLSPIATKREIEDSTEILEKITGKRPKLYRPPYGRLNLFTYLYTKEYRVVLWSSIFQDWKIQDPYVLQQSMKSQLSDGAIYLLHDDGENESADTTAPSNTIQALKGFLPEALSLGYKCVNVHEHLDEKSVQRQKRIL